MAAQPWLSTSERPEFSCPSCCEIVLIVMGGVSTVVGDVEETSCAASLVKLLSHSVARGNRRWILSCTSITVKNASSEFTL